MADDISDVLPLTKATELNIKENTFRFGTQLAPRSLPHNARAKFFWGKITHLKEQSCRLLLKIKNIEKWKWPKAKYHYIVFSRENET